MITPILNMTITGAVWYQGESNQGDAPGTGPHGRDQHSDFPMMTYGCRFPAMIADWRSKWHHGSMGQTAADFPFGFVNLAPWKNPNNAPASVRWAQTAGYGTVPNERMPNTFTAIAIDLTDNTSPFGSVHIRDKTTVGERLAAAGIRAVYSGGAGYVQGPTLSHAVRSGASAVKLTFANAGTAGLQVKAAAAQDVAFEMCEDEGNARGTNCSLHLAAGEPGSGWHAAPVSSSDETTVTVTGAGFLTSTVSVRYAWAAVPFQYKAAVLYGGDSEEGMLPAGGFVVGGLTLTPPAPAP
jgi:sialate O-acetylesterase